MATNVFKDEIHHSDSDEEESSYSDIMMVGRTGFGKSTVGNKLLGIDSETKSLLGVYRKGEDITNVIKQWDFDGDKIHYFETGEGTGSVTKKCKVLSNETTMDRVLDTRGFADTENTRKFGVIKGNLQSFRWILQAQRAYNLRFSRVLYFLPNRGPPERSDGTLQEEISVMYSYFGQIIFDVMVIVVTNNKRDRYQQIGFSEEDIAETKKVFTDAFSKVTGTDLPKCPPVIYIPFNEDHTKVMRMVIGADVISDAEVLYFSPEYPKVRKFDEEGEEAPLVKISSPIDEKKETFRKYRGKCFRFEDRCTRCAIKLIVQERLPSGAEIPVRVFYENGDEEEYDNTYCHPFFIPKYTRPVRIIGGIAHVIAIALGMGKVYERISKKKSWPTLTNYEEVCVHCKEPPGSDGCAAVNQPIEICGQDYRVDHTKELDTVKLLEEDKESK